MKLLSSFLGKPRRYSSVTPKNDSYEIIARSKFRELIEMERQRVHRDNQQFSLLLFNADPNNRNGLSVDHMARQIHKRIRRIDRLGWYDDFLIGVLLPNTSSDGAQVVGELIANELTNGQDDSGESIPFQTMSYPMVNGQTS